MATNNALNNNIAACTGLPVTGLSLATNSSMIVTSNAGVASMTASMTDGQIIVGTTSGTPAPATITAGTGISVTNGAGSITIAATSSDPSWSVITASQSAVANGGYITNSGSLVTITLPATAAVGSTISIAGMGAGGWLVAQNALQSIRVGSAVSTVGTGGSIASANQYDSMELVCIVANTTWTCFTGPLSAGLDIV